MPPIQFGTLYRYNPAAYADKTELASWGNAIYTRAVEADHEAGLWNNKGSLHGFVTLSEKQGLVATGKDAYHIIQDTDNRFDVLKADLKNEYKKNQMLQTLLDKAKLAELLLSAKEAAFSAFVAKRAHQIQDLPDPEPAVPPTLTRVASPPPISALA